MLIETYFDQNGAWNFLQSAMELFEQHLNNTYDAMEFHGTSASKPEVPWIPWNFVQIQSSIEFYGTSNFPNKSSMEFHRTFLKFHGIPWNSMELDKFDV